MKALVVGAGAVGRVFAWHLRRGGARVGFLVRPEHAAALGEGFLLERWGWRAGVGQPVHFGDYSLCTSLDEVAADRWDIVLLCVSSTALQRGRWLEELGGATGTATVVGLQPGIEDPDYVRQRVGAERVVWGMIQLVSMAKPAPSETTELPGVSYWIPPLTKAPFAGPQDRTREVVEAFERGGLEARACEDVAGEMALTTAYVDTYIAALECAGWRLRRLRRDRALLALARRSAKEAVAAATARHGLSRRHSGQALVPLLVRLALRLAPRLAPFDLEGYFRVHFTKVGDQTRQSLQTYIDLAEQRDLEHHSLDRLARQLEELSALQPAAGGAVTAPEPKASDTGHLDASSERARREV